MFQTFFNKENRIWHGYMTPPLYNPNISMGQAILKALELNPLKVAQISDNNNIQMTNANIRLKTVRAAQNIQQLGYKPKDIFAIMATDNHHLAPIVFASLCLNCTMSLINPISNELELQHNLSIALPKLMFCDANVYSLVVKCFKDVNHDVQIFTFGGKVGNSKPVEDLFAETLNEKRFFPNEVDGINDTAFIICSSGTTNKPKGVCLSHAGFLDNISKYIEIDSNDILFCANPIFALTGLITLFHGTLCGTTRIITTHPFTPDYYLKILEKYKVTYVLIVTGHHIVISKCAAIKTTNLKWVRHYICAGTRLSLESCIAMKKYLPNADVCAAYGLTELGSAPICNSPFTALDTVGKIINGVQVKIIDANKNKCGIDEDGEICIRTPYKFLGYYDNAKATFEATDNDGFVYTGDCGHFDKDGFLYLVDRKIDIFRYFQSPISPTEIETYLINSPRIKMVCVVGISDNVAGCLPTAVVVKAPNAEITKEEIQHMVKERFENCKWLRGGVYFVDSLPTTPSGKLVRRYIKATAEELARGHSKNF